MERRPLVVVMVLALGASVGCGSHGSAVAPPVEHAGVAGAPAHDDGRYHYDPARGACVDAGGAAGFNTTTLAQLEASGDGECVDFAASGISSLNDLGSFKDYAGWNLRGARFATLATYVRVVDADLAGADLGDLKVFYFCVTGAVDSHTVLGEATEGCTGEDGRLRCGDSCER